MVRTSFSPAVSPPVAPSALAGADRLAAVRALGIRVAGTGANADAALTATLEGLVRVARQVTGAAVGLVSLVEGERDVWLAAAGLPPGVPADGSAAVRPTACAAAVAEGAPIVVEDLGADPRARTFRLAVESGMGALIATPIVSTAGHALGCLTLADPAPRRWSAADRSSVADLAAACAAALERHAARAALHDVLDGHVDAAFLLASVRDAAGRVADFVVADGNARAAALLGLEPEAAIGRRWSELLAGEPAAGLATTFTRVAEQGAPLELELEARDSRLAGDAGPRWLRLQAARVGDGVAVTVRDVSAQRAAEAAAAEREARFRALIEHSHELIGVIAADGTILYESPAITRVLGHDPEALVGRPGFDLVHPDDVPQVAERLAALIASPGTSAPVAYRCRHADGSWRMLEGDAWNLVDHPAVGGVVVNARDVTDREAAARALREGEARLRLALDGANDGLWDWHVPSDTFHYSPRWYTMLGYAPGEMPPGHATFESLLHPDDAAQARAMGAAAFAPHAGRARAEVQAEFRLRARDGTWRWVHSRGAVVERDAEGRPVRVAGTHSDVTDRKALEAELVRQATTDALTGLANRDRFRARTEAALAAAAAADAPGRVAALFLDLDDFKGVNDGLGHAAGDRLLRAAASRLLNATRGCDLVARLGGDEFAVLLENVGADGDAWAVAERIVRAFAAPFAVGDGAVAGEVLAPASVGVARARAGDSAGDLLRNADLAMYRAKGSGKGRVAAFAPDMHAALVDRVGLAADLRRAVEGLGGGAGPFAVAYQPVVELGTGRAVAAEALVRWQHPERGPVSPAAFIPVAEETGLIVPLGRWVLRAACREAARWRAAAPAPELAPRVTVNVSARQLQEPNFVGDVADALAAAGLPAAALVLELTEGVLVRETDAALERLRALRALGVGLALDDFGTGYSSLSYLQRFPMDVLKIDKAFVDRVAEGGSHAGLARAVVALARSLGLRAIAEGVETAEQRDALAALGCRWGQGYLFGRPLPPDTVAERFAAEAAAAQAAADAASASAAAAAPVRRPRSPRPARPSSAGRRAPRRG